MGFMMILGWFVLLAMQIYNEMMNDTRTDSAAWLGETGAAVFAAAWVWSLVTSLSVLRKARTAEPAPPPRLQA
jgi:hypothetical protein